MKRNILSAIFVIAIVFASTAQQGRKGHHKSQLTPDQKVTLGIKKMTLALGLSSSQQQKLRPILLEAASKRMKMMQARKENRGQRKEMSSDAIFAKMNNALDQKIAFQNKIKNILKNEQFEKWQKISSKMHKKRGAKMMTNQKRKQGHSKMKGKKRAHKGNKTKA